MMLEDLIALLEAEDPKKVCPDGFTNPHSYRGYYHELAFEPAVNVTVADMLEDAKSALGTTYTGYKGGDFTMDKYSDCWLSYEGHSSGDSIGPLLMRLMLANGRVPESLPEAVSMSSDFLRDVSAERVRQVRKWGDQRHPDGTALWGDAARAENARDICQAMAARDRTTWRGILAEEVAEAEAESDPVALRAELVQVAAVCAAWVYDIDRRSAPKGDS